MEKNKAECEAGTTEDSTFDGVVGKTPARGMWAETESVSCSISPAMLRRNAALSAQLSPPLQAEQVPLL